MRRSNDDDLPDKYKQPFTKEKHLELCGEQAIARGIKFVQNARDFYAASGFASFSLNNDEPEAAREAIITAAQRKTEREHLFKQNTFCMSDSYARLQHNRKYSTSGIKRQRKFSPNKKQ